MRPLAKRGYVVLAFSYPMDGIDGLRDSLELVNWSYSHLHLRKICLLGTGVGGRNAMLLACSNPMKQKISCVAAINASVDWPFPELAPMQQIKNLNVPLLAFIDSDCTDIVSGEMQIFEKACTAQKKHLEVQSFINADKTSYDKWFYIFQKLDAFFNSSL